MAQKAVLIIDDEQGFLEAFADALIAEGYRVITASTGEAGLQALANEQVDLVTLDVMMAPGPSLEPYTTRSRAGVYLCHEIRRRFPKLPVFCLSVISDRETIAEIRKTGARFFGKGETPLRRMLDMIRSRLTGVAYSTQEADRRRTAAGRGEARLGLSSDKSRRPPTKG